MKKVLSIACAAGALLAVTTVANALEECRGGYRELPNGVIVSCNPANDFGYAPAPVYVAPRVYVAPPIYVGPSYYYDEPYYDDGYYARRYYDRPYYSRRTPKYTRSCAPLGRGVVGPRGC